MKRQGNLLSFAFFGLVAEAVLLLLLKQQITAQATYGFVFAANAFMLYRVYIREQSFAEQSFFKKELRRWWLRQEPENTLSFAFIGGMVLVVCNIWTVQGIKPLDIWVMGFVSIALTQILFEQTRKLWNSFHIYLVTWVKKQKIKKIMEVKKRYENTKMGY